MCKVAARLVDRVAREGLFALFFVVFCCCRRRRVANDEKNVNSVLW